MTAFVAVVCGLLGLAVGSFLNVVIHRVPRRESVIRPRSKCPSCGTPIAERDNIPVVSWVRLRGRCRSCGQAISVRYPLIELATAGLFVAVGLRFGASWALPAYLVFAALLLAISAIDLERYIVPNRLVAVGLALGVPLLGLASAIEGEWRPMVTALVGGAAAFAALLVLNLISPRGMGMGDVKLASVLGLHLGWLGGRYVALGLFLGFVLGAVGGILLIVVRVRTRKDHVPFAPFLAGGALVAVLFGAPILRAYLGT